MKQPPLFDQHERFSLFMSSPAASVDARQGLNHHGHLRRQVVPHTDSTHFVNVGWDVTQGLVCL